MKEECSLYTQCVHPLVCWWILISFVKANEEKDASLHRLENAVHQVLFYATVTTQKTYALAIYSLGSYFGVHCLAQGYVDMPLSRIKPIPFASLRQYLNHDHVRTTFPRVESC